MSETSCFWLGNSCSLNHGIILTAPPPIVFAEREIEAVSVAGRSGDLIFDTGRYKNVPIPYECAIIPEAGNSLRDTAVSALNLLRSAAGYSRLENTFQKDTFRVGRVASKISIESIMEQAGRFTVEFDCKPQRFKKSGEKAVPFSVEGQIWNSTEFEALPLIYVYGSAAGTVMVGGTTVEIKEISDQIILDCDIQNAYRQVADSAPENCNGMIYAPEFPKLLPGLNPVSFAGGISKVEIIPRWWTL